MPTKGVPEQRAPSCKHKKPQTPFGVRGNLFRARVSRKQLSRQRHRIARSRRIPENRRSGKQAKSSAGYPMPPGKHGTPAPARQHSTAPAPARKPPTQDPSAATADSRQRPRPRTDPACRPAISFPWAPGSCSSSCRRAWASSPPWRTPPGRWRSAAAGFHPAP